MKFMITYRISPENRNTSGQRFQETGGGPPKGVTMLGRWHKAAGLGGWVLCETSSAEAAANWCYQWNDVLEFDIAPVIDDKEAARVLGRVLK
jgi:hypothetical protein